MVVRDGDRRALWASLRSRDLSGEGRSKIGRRAIRYSEWDCYGGTDRHPREMLSPVVGVVTPAESLQERLRHDAEATRVGLSTATRKASVRLAERDGDEVVYASARLKDVVAARRNCLDGTNPLV